MVDFRSIYQHQPEQYDRLVSYEDYQGNIQRTLQRLVDLEGATVVELGAGTGRLTRLLAPQVRAIWAVDCAPPMLRVAQERLAQSGRRNWKLIQADNRFLPIAPATADLAIAGWSLGHATEWYSRDWTRQVDRTLREMGRVTRPGGALIIIETLGTGSGTPRPPTPALEAYYRRLERVFGFRRHWARTDYAFESPAQARQLIGFFFGPQLAQQVEQAGRAVVPECTGFWMLQPAHGAGQ